jgi:hypothetical protein
LRGATLLKIVDTRYNLLTIRIANAKTKPNLIFQVKQLAATKYNYTFAKGEVVSTFVAAFYDAVLLYALALNATLEQANNTSGPLEGPAVIKNMWNRTFQGKLIGFYSP